MALAEPHANLERHMANIEDSIKQERQAMEEAEIETGLATRKRRQYTVWLARDSKKKKTLEGRVRPQKTESHARVVGVKGSRRLASY